MVDRRSTGPSVCRPTRLEVDLTACVDNLRQVQERVGRREVWPVVKADAYGHGAARVARALERERVAGFCVATPTEGRQLRLAGVSTPILVMGPLAPGGEADPYETVVEYGLSAGVPDATTAQRLAEAADRLTIGPASVHLKLDTGMGRLGLSGDQVVAVAAAVRAEPGLSLDGLFSNLATADSYGRGAAGVDLVVAQAQHFREICAALEADDNLPAVRTLANSSGVAHHPVSWDDRAFTGVRPGLALYGATLTPDAPRLALRPAMRWVSQVAAIRRLPEGANIGYGGGTVLRRPSRIAVLPLGYHDGLPRRLGDRAEVLVRGRRAPLIGRISMDITLVDVTDVTAAAAGDEVVLMGSIGDPGRTGRSRDEVFAGTLSRALGADDDEASGAGDARRSSRTAPSVEELAAWADTIPHEILSRLGARLPRIYPDTAAAKPEVVT